MQTQSAMVQPAVMQCMNVVRVVMPGRQILVQAKPSGDVAVARGLVLRAQFQPLCRRAASEVVELAVAKPIGETGPQASQFRMGLRQLR